MLYVKLNTQPYGGTMSSTNETFLKYISIIQRNYTRYMDYELEKKQIGYGQQFFLPCIYEYDGITMYDLAKIGRFDKGTVTKAVQKLIEEGYVISETDENDRRVKHLHITPKSIPVIELIYELRDRWKNIIIKDISIKDEEKLKFLLKEIPENSCEAMKDINLRKVR